MVHLLFVWTNNFFYPNMAKKEASIHVMAGLRGSGVLLPSLLTTILFLPVRCLRI